MRAKPASHLPNA